MPRNPKHMFHICQNDNRGLSALTSDAFALSAEFIRIPPRVDRARRHDGAAESVLSMNTYSSFVPGAL
jgi:hypothetical protein